MIDIDPEKIARNPWFAGAVGALVALRGAPGDSWPMRCVNVLSGMAIAGLLTEGVAQYFGMTAPAMQGAVAFLLGLFGMNLVSAVTTALKETKLSDVLPWKRKE